jgi:glycosyltransferase involved in cell wall biosynthesis
MGHPARRSVCFFAPVSDRSALQTTEFYAQDIQILRDLGFEPRIATRWREIPWHCDLYYVWWWTWAFLPLLKARLTGRPVLIAGVIDSELYPARRRLERALIRASFETANLNLLTSQVEHRWVLEQMSSKRAVHLPCAVDSDVYTPGTGPRADFCLTVCWMKRDNARRKCMFELIRAVPAIRAAVPGLRFRIAGDPQDAGTELAALARELGVADAVEFLGRIDKTEKIRLMQTCQIYVQPTRFEGFGLAIAEALSCGAPVVTSRAGAVPEVVGDFGEYVDGADPESIAAGVIRLARDPDLRLGRSRAGRERIEREFAIERRRRGIAAAIAAAWHCDPSAIAIATPQPTAPPA